MYGIDTADPAIMRGRSWRWLRVRIEQLLTIPPAYLADGRPVQATRLGHTLFPIPEQQRR